MSSIYYINFNQDGGATSTDEVKAAQKAAAIRIQAKSRSASDRKQFLAKKQATIRMQAISRGEKVRSCINELDYFINHKEKCKNQPINYDTKNHLVLGEPQKMIKQDGREWIVYNATIQNNAKNEDSFQTITEEQVDTSELFNEGQIGGKYKKIKISSIKKKIFQDNEDIYLVDPSIRTIPKKHNHIQALVAPAGECAAAASIYPKEHEKAGQPRPIPCLPQKAMRDTQVANILLAARNTGCSSQAQTLREKQESCKYDENGNLIRAPQREK